MRWPVRRHQYSHSRRRTAGFHGQIQGSRWVRDGAIEHRRTDHSARINSGSPPIDLGRHLHRITILTAHTDGYGHKYMPDHPRQSRAQPRHITGSKPEPRGRWTPAAVIFPARLKSAVSPCFAGEERVGPIQMFRHQVCGCRFVARLQIIDKLCMLHQCRAFAT